MSRYLEVAAEANKLAANLMEFIHEEADRPVVAELVARIVNLAVRSCPRGVQHTVRLNIVRAAVQGLPVRVGMEARTDEKTGRVYHALTTVPTGTQRNLAPTVEGPSEE